MTSPLRSPQPDEIITVLSDIFQEQLDWSGEVTPQLRLVEDIGLDSIRLLTLVVEVENHFRICLEEGDEEGVVTVADLVALIGDRLAN